MIMQAEGEFIVLMDADLSHHPRYIPKFLDRQVGANFDRAILFFCSCLISLTPPTTCIPTSPITWIKSSSIQLGHAT